MPAVRITILILVIRQDNHARYKAQDGTEKSFHLSLVPLVAAVEGLQIARPLGLLDNWQSNR
jgi:hypothetical protein